MTLYISIREFIGKLNSQAIYKVHQIYNLAFKDENIKSKQE